MTSRNRRSSISSVTAAAFSGCIRRPTRFINGRNTASSLGAISTSIRGTRVSGSTSPIDQIRDFDAGGSHVLIRLDPASVDLNRENVHRHPYGWPLAWTRAYGNGRVFYTALGHEEAVWRDSRFQTLLHNAVLWAIRHQ